MTDVYCDIVPEPTGWSFVVEATHSPTYMSYRLCLEAARRYRDTASDDHHTIVLRHQDLQGTMKPLPVAKHVFAPSRASL